MTPDAAYIESALAHLAADDAGAPLPFWRHFHWGLFEGPGPVDDSPAGYLAAAEALTDLVVEVAGIGDGDHVLDVGCGFGGTLDHVRRWCRPGPLVGVNVDVRQLRWGRRLLGDEAAATLRFVAADGCRLPLQADACDRVLAVECVFHFPSRRAFFAEAARVLRPGGSLTLTDFVVAPGALAAVAAAVAGASVGEGTWYGRVGKPLTVAGYQRLGRRTGLELQLDLDVTAETLPTYPALRRLAQGAGSTDGLAVVDALDSLARDAHLGYHVLRFKRTRFR